MLAKVSVIVRTAFAFSFLTHAAVLALRVAFLNVEASRFLNDHITALHDGAHVSVHFELQNNEIGSFIC